MTVVGSKAGAATSGSGRLDTVSCSLWKNCRWMVRAGLDLEGDIRAINATKDDGPLGGLAASASTPAGRLTTPTSRRLSATVDVVCNEMYAEQ